MPHQLLLPPGNVHANSGFSMPIRFRVRSSYGKDRQTKDDRITKSLSHSHEIVVDLASTFAE